MPFSDVETPALLIDSDRLFENVRSMQERAARAGVALRPHVKTHKCHQIGRLQVASGAVGITASKPDEAISFIENGFRSVTIAYPIISRTKLARVFDAAQKHGADLRMIVDSATGVEAIIAVAHRRAMKIDLFVKIDVGLHRCGLGADDPRLVPLVRQIVAEPGFRFAGLLSHAGQSYGAASVEAIGAIAAAEMETLGRAAETLRHDAIDVEEISIGATPTVLASDSFGDATEIRPGNYVFLDRTQLALGVATREQIALSLLATVVSAGPDYLIIDAGSKSLSSDLGPHGLSTLTGYGIAHAVDEYASAINPMTIERLSEEHGFVRHGGAPLPIGSRVRIIPNHACTAANLADRYTVVRGDEVIEEWRVDARGKVR
jgi:D-serine deaminase-like pyridoxal phosphate-dependent protein